MKNDRQTAVLQIIEETAVETQEQLMHWYPWMPGRNTGETDFMSICC